MKMQITTPYVQKISFELEQHAKLPDGKGIICSSLDGREFGARGFHKLYYMDDLTITYTDMHFPLDVRLTYDLDRDFIVMVFVMEGNSVDVEDGENGTKRFYNSNEHCVVYRKKNKGALHLPIHHTLKALRIVFDPNFFFNKVDSNSHVLFQEFVKNVNNHSTSRLYPYNGLITAEMHAVIREIAGTTKKGQFLRLFLEAKSLELLLMILEQYDELARKPLKADVKVEDILIKAKSFLERSEGRITLDQVARHAGSNIATLKKQFKQYYNSTVMEYWKKVKMQEVHQKLLSEDYTTKEAAAFMGYGYTHHFSKAFEQEFGYTPYSLIKSRV